MDQQSIKYAVQAEISRVIYEHDKAALKSKDPLFPIGATGLLNESIDKLFSKWSEKNVK